MGLRTGNNFSPLAGLADCVVSETEAKLALLVTHTEFVHIKWLNITKHNQQCMHSGDFVCL